MNQKFVATAEVRIHAPRGKVWEALTKPDLIKQYLFGTDVTTDWQVGSPITYRGEWKGKAYEDKGRVVRVEPETLLVSTFWSSLSGLPDVPENYKTVTYALADEGGATRVSLTQDNNASREEADHSRRNWEMVLGTLKELLETEP
jgi:uncharacterized protein YndB with AHSA1/START domain